MGKTRAILGGADIKGILEGTMAHGIFDNNPSVRDRAIAKFNTLMSSPVTAADVDKKLYDLFFDDQLWDIMDEKYATWDDKTAKNVYDKTKDVRSIIVRRLKQLGVKFDGNKISDIGESLDEVSPIVNPEYGPLFVASNKDLKVLDSMKTRWSTSERDRNIAPEVKAFLYALSEASDYLQDLSTEIEVRMRGDE